MQIGAYTLLKTLGHGGMATVWLVQHASTGQEYALKVILPQHAQGSREAFLSEIRILSELDHPNLIKLYDYGILTADEGAQLNISLPEGSPYCVMEYHPHGTYADQPIPESWDELKLALEQLLTGLSVTHSLGIIHCDLKPSNILRGSHGPVISDFGIAQRLDRSTLSRGSSDEYMSGTPSYISPEQIKRDFARFGPWTDLYSLGCIVYKLCTGQTPFHSHSTLHTVLAHLEDDPPPLHALFPLPDGFEAWVRWCLEKQPLDRPRFAASALLQLQKITSSPPERAVSYLSLKRGVSDSRGLNKAHPALWTRYTQYLQTDDQSLKIFLLTGQDRSTQREVCQTFLRQVHQEGLASPMVIHCEREVSERSGISGLLRREWCAYDMSHQELSVYLNDCFLDSSQLGSIDESDLSSLASFISIPEQHADFASQRARFSAFNRWLDQRLQECPRVLWLQDIQWGRDVLKWLSEAIHSERHSSLFVLISHAHSEDSSQLRDPRAHQLPSQVSRDLTFEQVLQSLPTDVERLDVDPLDHFQCSPKFSDLETTHSPLIELIELASVLGHEFSLSLLERVAQRFGVASPHAQIAEWIQRGVLQVEGQERLCFRDSDLRESCLLTLVETTKFKHIHRLVVEERLKEPNVPPILLIQHWLAADEPRRALALLPQEVERLKRSDDYVHLKHRLDLWLFCLRRLSHKREDEAWLDFKVKWAEYWGLVADQKRSARHASRAYQSLTRSHPTSPLIIEACIRRAEALKWNLDQSEEVLELMKRAVQLAHQIKNPLTQTFALERQAIFYHTYGQLEAAEASFRQALELLDSSVVPSRLRSIIHLGIGRLLIELDQIELARTHCLFALRVLNPDDHKTLRASILLTLGDISRQLNLTDEALSQYQEARDTFSRIGAPEIWAAHLNLAMTYCDLEDWFNADKHFARALYLTIKSQADAFTLLIKSSSLYRAARCKEWTIFDPLISELLSLDDQRYAQFDSANLLERLAFHLQDEEEHARAQLAWKLCSAHFTALGLTERAMIAERFID